MPVNVVEKLSSEAEGAMERRYGLTSQGIDLGQMNDDTKVLVFRLIKTNALALCVTSLVIYRSIGSNVDIGTSGFLLPQK